MYYLDGSGNAAYNGGTISIDGQTGQLFTLQRELYLVSHSDDGTFTTFVSTPQDLYNRALEGPIPFRSSQSFCGQLHRQYAKSEAPSYLRNLEFSSIITWNRRVLSPCSSETISTATPTQ